MHPNALKTLSTTVSKPHFTLTAQKSDFCYSKCIFVIQWWSKRGQQNTKLEQKQTNLGIQSWVADSPSLQLLSKHRSPCIFCCYGNENISRCPCQVKLIVSRLLALIKFVLNIPSFLSLRWKREKKRESSLKLKPVFKTTPNRKQLSTF